MHPSEKIFCPEGEILIFRDCDRVSARQTAYLRETLSQLWRKIESCLASNNFTLRCKCLDEVVDMIQVVHPLLGGELSHNQLAIFDAPKATRSFGLVVSTPFSQFLN